MKHVYLALAVFLVISGCDQPSPSKKSGATSEGQSTANTDGSKPTATSATSGPVSKWSYSEDVDKMRGTKSHFASIQSENELTFDFPYKGGYATLMLRQRPSDGLNILLTVEGQFLCNSYADDTVAVKFDNGSIQNYGCSEPRDASSGLLFIENAKRFVAKLKTSKSVIIEAQFFQSGRRQIEFNVSGLEWK